MVRCLLFRDCLERLKCTKADIAHLCDRIGQPTAFKGTEESKMASAATDSGANAMDDLFAQIDQID